MKLCALLSVTLASCAWAADTPRNDGLSWATLHGDLQRSGFHLQFPKGPLRMVWCKELWRELTGPRAEVIVGGGLAFMGTYAGSLYAWDASTGAEKCVFKTGGPIGHSLVFSDGTVFVGSMDRSQGQLFCTHQGNFGAFNLKTGLIANLFGKRDSYGGFHGGANFGWESQSGCERAKAAGQPYGLVNQWHGPARAIVSVADKKIYFPVGSQVICLEGAP